MSLKRGAFIVLEGCDRAGKTTQCLKLVDLLNESGVSTKYMNFPDRSTDSGKLIDSYLKCKDNYNGETIHLLFTINRWEVKTKMEKLLNTGTSLIVDRYSYSGVAFSAAKGLDLDWCKAPEKGLLKPDLVIYLTLTAEAMAKRAGFGNERYEQPEMQKTVKKMYEKLMDSSYWQTVDADKTQEQLSEELGQLIMNTINSVEGKKLDTLW